MDTATIPSIRTKLTWLFLFQITFIFLFAADKYLIALSILLSLFSCFYIFSGPGNGLVLLPLFLYMPFEIPGLGGIQFSEIGSFLIILSFVFFILASHQDSEYSFPALAPLLTILVASFFSMINAKYLIASIKDILKYIAAFLIFFYCTVNFVNKKDIILKIFISTVIAGFLTACIGIFHYIVGMESRLYGLLGGNFGAFIGISLIIAINILIFSNKLFYKVISIITMPVLAGALILSQTRAWLMGFIIALIFIFIKLVKKGKRIKFILILMPLIVLIMILLNVNILSQSKSQIISEGAQKAFESGLGKGETLGRYVSILQRIFIWSRGFQIYLDHPVFGFGVGNLRIKNYFTGELGKPGTPGVGYIDNHWLHVWFETGILGIFGWLWFTIIIYKKSKKLLELSTKPEWNLISLSLIGIMIIFLIGGMFWTPTVVHETITLIPVQIALIFASIRILETEKAHGDI